MPITFDCPACTLSLTAPDGEAGRPFTCPRCSEQLRVPAVAMPFDFAPSSPPRSRPKASLLPALGVGLAILLAGGLVTGALLLRPPPITVSAAPATVAATKAKPASPRPSLPTAAAEARPTPPVEPVQQPPRFRPQVGEWCRIVGSAPWAASDAAMLDIYLGHMTRGEAVEMSEMRSSRLAYQLQAGDIFQVAVVNDRPPYIARGRVIGGVASRRVAVVQLQFLDRLDVEPPSDAEINAAEFHRHNNNPGQPFVDVLTLIRSRQP